MILIKLKKGLIESQVVFNILIYDKRTVIYFCLFSYDYDKKTAYNNCAINKALMSMQVPEDIDEFQTHPATTNNKQHSMPNYSVFEACRLQSQVLLHGALQESVTKLLRVVRQIQIADKSIQIPNKRQKTNIYPIVLKPNQVDQLPFYLQKLVAKLDKNLVEDGQNKNRALQMKPIFEIQSKQMMIKQKKGTDVRDILLDIYEDSEDIKDKPYFKFYIYVITQVTDLSEENLYIFSKGMTNKNFVAFLPTFQTFDDQSYEAINRLNLQKFSFKMYDQKLLFSKYIYNCIINPKIKAYLPVQVLSLVSDMNYYSLSFFQSCRRFDYCLNKALKINSKQRQEVSCDEAIQRIQNIIKKNFDFIYETDWFNILKVILAEEQTYKISNKKLSMFVSNKKVQLGSDNFSQQYIDQFNTQEFIEEVIKSFKRNLPADLLKIFQKEDEEMQKKTLRRNKRDQQRIKRLQIVSHTSKTPKMILENKITRIIKTLTKNVREYAKTVKWSLFKFNERIKPSIPLKLVNSMRNQKKVEYLVEQVTSYHFKPLSSLLALFGEDYLGEGLYFIKTLQLSGLITLSKKQINPLVYNNFYQKAKFN